MKTDWIQQYKYSKRICLFTAATREGFPLKGRCMAFGTLFTIVWLVSRLSLSTEYLPQRFPLRGLTHTHTHTHRGTHTLIGLHTRWRHITDVHSVIACICHTGSVSNNSSSSCVVVVANTDYGEYCRLLLMSNKKNQKHSV